MAPTFLKTETTALLEVKRTSKVSEEQAGHQNISASGDIFDTSEHFPKRDNPGNLETDARDIVPINENFEDTGRILKSDSNLDQDKFSPEEGKSSKKRFKFGELNHRKKYLLLCCILSHFMSGLSTSLLAPFYPQVAQEKGMSLLLIGVTFSIFPVIIFITSPFFGLYMTRIGPKCLVITGLIIAGACNCLCGTLDKFGHGVPFIVASLVCRLVEGLAFSAYCNAVFTILLSEFLDHASFTLSFLQTSSELGIMLGPGIGGFLNELAGFGTPFYSTGIAVILIGLVLLKAIPDFTVKEKEGKKTNHYIPCNGLVLAAIASLSTGSSGICFLEATLANHLAPLGLSTGMIGLCFSIVPCIFVITSPICGYLTDVKGIQAYLLVFGQFLFGIGFYLVGPGFIFPFLHLTIWAVVPGLILIGVSFAMETIPVYKCLLLGLLESGWENNMDTYAAVSCMTNTSYFFGAIVGPLIGSAMLQQQGYSFGYTVMGTWNMAAACLCLVIFISRSLKSKK